MPLFRKRMVPAIPYSWKRSFRFYSRFPEFSQWKSAVVQLNYYIAINFGNYSIPYEYIHKKVNVWYTTNSFIGITDSIPHSRIICPSTINCTVNGAERGPSNGHPVSVRQPSGDSGGL